MHESTDLSGLWECEIPGFTGLARLPGTLDENGIGFPDLLKRPWHPDEAVNEALGNSGPIATRLTRRNTYEGPAAFRRTVETRFPPEKRVFLEIGRARHLTLQVNGLDIPHFGPHTLSTPQIFELTGALTGCDELELISDNSYPGWPSEDIISSSAATDETQTNWNGILGYIRIAVREPSFISSLRVYPESGAIRVCWDISGQDGPVTVESPAIPGPVTASGVSCVIPLSPDLRLWDEGEGALYPLTATLGGDSVTVSFGVRELGVPDGHIALNGRKLFIRGEANCAVFPETGHEPTDTDTWREILKTYMSYGVNLLRFHSHCPPEAAFEAADGLGLLLQPELSNWDPKSAFSTPESREYYRSELMAILRTYANHPSFAMLSLGNELAADEDAHAFMEELLREAKKYDPTRLYACGSNNHYGERPLDSESDFYTSCSYLGAPLRGTSANMAGWLNDPDSGFTVNYTKAVERVHALRPVPVISFEVGQFEVLPDFSELSEFRGVTDPANLRLIRDRAASRGLLPRWRDYCSASGELALISYRMEVEAALRTPGMAGVSLLGLQDFPGQGTALVGMLTSHLRPKPFPFARPERFRAFFTGVLPLLELQKFTYTAGETLTAHVKFANYGRTALSGTPGWSLSSVDIIFSGTLPHVTADVGTLSDIGLLTIPLTGFDSPAKVTITINFCDYVNHYDVLVYPDEEISPPWNVHICRRLDGSALDVLRGGGRVYLEPESDREHLSGAVRGQFSTDFWSVGTFPTQEGGMGLFIEKDHPAFDGFPTGSHSDLQWRRLSGAFALPLPEGAVPLVTLMDCVVYMRRLAFIFECRCGGGSLLVSTFGLPELKKFPEARALRRSILRYISSAAFAPEGEVDVDTIRDAIK